LLRSKYLQTLLNRKDIKGRDHTRVVQKYTCLVIMTYLLVPILDVHLYSAPYNIMEDEN
jgi:hypothetical protein